MDTRLLRILNEQIEKIPKLKTLKRWGPIYHLWDNTTKSIVKDLFGNDYLELYEKQNPTSFSYIDDTFNQKQYLRELDNKKIFLESAIKEFERLESDSLLNIGRSIGLSDYDLHSKIKEVVGTKFQTRHYADAVESAFKEVIKRVKDYIKEKIGEELDGDRAMNRAFGFENQIPLIKFNSLQTREELDEQRGIMFLFKAIVCIRNRKAHENIILDDPYRTLEYLALASLLMRLLDKFTQENDSSARTNP